MRASVENDRVQNAVLTIEGSLPLLQGLYFLHVSAHRQRANEWSDIIDIDPGAFQSISDNLVSSYKQLLSEAMATGVRKKWTMPGRTLLKS
jgi:hypothetical protein